MGYDWNCIVWKLVQLSRNDRVVPYGNEIVYGIYAIVKQKQGKGA